MTPLDTYVIAGCIVVACLFSGLVTYVITGKGRAALTQIVAMIGGTAMVLGAGYYVLNH